MEEMRLLAAAAYLILRRLSCISGDVFPVVSLDISGGTVTYHTLLSCVNL